MTIEVDSRTCRQVFLHHDSLPGLDFLLDPALGGAAARLLYGTGQPQRADIADSLRALDTSQRSG